MVFFNTYSKPSGIMINMVIDNRLLFFGGLFISLSYLPTLREKNTGLGDATEDYCTRTMLPMSRFAERSKQQLENMINS